MDLKKVQTVITAEEQHLASKSTKYIVKKTTKANTSFRTKLKDQISHESCSFDGPNEMNEAVILNTRDTIDNNIGTSDITEKKSKSKKNKKGNLHSISVKTSFNKFDALQKRDLIHVRSSDTGKAQEIFSNSQSEKQSICCLCSKPVYKMEEIKAERRIFHKKCFRCHECSKQLKGDNYQSHSGTLYCLVHFKLLFAPKVVEDPEEAKPRKAELIIRESQPTELPPDVVRASDKPDLGLEELQQLNVRSRFQVFENAAQKQIDNSPKPHIEVKSSRSILSKLAKLQQHGFANSISCDLSTCDDNNFQSSDESEMELPGNTGEDFDAIRSKKCVQRDRPIGMGEEALHDIKSKFENGHQLSKEERREERKQEIQNIRSRLFMGKQAKIKEMYQQAVAESEQRVTSVEKTPIIETGTEALSIKERFEKGEMFKKKVKGTTGNGGLSDEVDVFESAISKKSRSIFMELDANVASGKLPNTPDSLQKQRGTQIKRHENHNEQENMHGNDQNAADVVKYDELQEDVKIATAEISEKFKFFETYCPKESFRPQFRMTPPRDGVVKMPTPETDSESMEKKTLFSDKVLQKTQTTSAMLNKFREMEQNKFLHSNKNEDGPRPLKCFTPPPDGGRRLYQDQNSDEEESDSEDYESEDGTQKRVLKTAATDEALKEAQAQARAKQLREKFEKWQSNEDQHEFNEGQVDVYSQNVSDDSTIESTKTIRERFETLKSSEQNPSRGPRYQVNRFV